MKSWKTWWMKLDQTIGKKLQGIFLIALMCNVCRDGRRFSIQSWWKDPGQKRSENLRWLFCHTTQQDVLANHTHNYCLFDGCIVCYVWSWPQVYVSGLGWTHVDVQLHWLLQEDDKVVELVRRYGPKRWSLIAQHLKGRIGKQCRERYMCEK